MTDDRAAKKAARDRMTRTGERYTAARRAERSGPAAAVPGEQPFFVALVLYHGIGAAADRASIRDARTGQVTALVPEVPGIPRFRAVTAAAGGLFYLTAGLPVRHGRAATFHAGDWVADSRTVASYEGGLRDAICPLISADGSAIYLSVPQPDPKGGPHWNQIVEVPLAGGEPRILFALRYTGNPANAMYMWTTVCRDQRGRFLLAFIPGYAYRVDIAAAASTRLPFPEGMPHEAAW